MSSFIAAEHAGLQCVYHEASDTWSTKLDGSDVSADSLTKLRQKIDRITKPKAERRPAIVLGGAYYSDGDAFVTVTSVDDDAASSRYRDAWVKLADGSRRKVGLSYLRADSPGNRERAQKRTDVQKRIKELQREFAALGDQMEPFNAPATEESDA